MAEQIVTIAEDTVVVSGGVSNLDVDVNFGGKGTDGNIILYGEGKPTDPDVEIKGTPKLLDWYINIDNTDDEYLYIYQYIYKNAQTTWSRVFKIIPNVYQTNKIVNFNSSGVGLANIVVTNTTLPLVPQYALPDQASTVFTVDNEAEMLAITGAVGTYAFRNDLAKYFYLSATPTSLVTNWKPLIAINAHVDIENQYPVASAFQIGIPEIDTDTESGEVAYLLPLTLVAYQIHPTLGILPITGEKTAHISINVV
jgi:hypothetical protein